MLSIHVGIYGSTEQYEVSAPPLLKNSICLNGGKSIKRLYNLVDTSKLFKQIYFDLELFNYDPTYKVILTFDNQESFEARVDQSINNKNIIFVRLFMQDNFYSDYSQITSIKVEGDEILDSPLTIDQINFTNFTSIFQTYSIQQLGENAFSIQYTPTFKDLEVYQVQIRTSDYSSQIIGSISPNYFSFNKLPNIQDYQHNFIIEGCSNKGSFIEYIPINQNKVVFREGKQTLTILNNPFPQNLIYPGQLFKVKFENFIPTSDFLCIDCKGKQYPLFSQSELNQDQIYEFQIPPPALVTPTDISEYEGCTLWHRSQWNSNGDKLLSKHSLLNENTKLLTQFIYQFTMIESKNEVKVVYSQKTNILINNITPQSISYLGGDLIEFRGTNLQNTSKDKVSVKINNIDCEVVEATTISIKCISGFQTKIQWLEESFVSINVNGIKVNMIAPPINIVFNQIDSVSFFGFLEFNKSGSKIYIPKYNSIIMDDIETMDRNSVNYDKVQIDGNWVFLNTISYEITLDRLIGDGSVSIGSESSPYGQKTFKLTVNSQTNIFSVSAYSNEKQIFYKLIESAFKEQNIIKIQNNQSKLENLSVGDELIITGTTLDSQNEKVIIQKIDNNFITLENNLIYDHIVAKENIQASDGSTYNFNVSPTVTKVNKCVQLILANQKGDYNEITNYNPPNRYFILSGVNFSFNSASTSQAKIYQFSAQNSILNILMVYGYDNYNCANIINLQNSIIYDWFRNCYQLSSNQQILIRNNLFLNSQFSDLYLDNISTASFIDNTLQGLGVQINNISDQTQKLIFKGNQIYNTDRCLWISIEQQKKIPIYMENNVCFSTKQGLVIQGNPIIESPSFYLVVVDIRYAALVNYHTNPNLISQQNIQGKAILQSKLTNSNTQFKPYAFQQYDSEKIKTLIQNKYTNIEFKGFHFNDSDYLVDNLSNLNWYLESFKNIKQDFSGNLLQNKPNLIIKDEDGSFSGINKPSNIFANILNLHDNTASCLNKSEYSICQNQLIHFQDISVLWHIYQQKDNFLFLKRSNDKIIQAFKNGFFVVNGELYQAQVVDSSNNEQILQLISLMIDYTQDESKGIVIIYPTNEDYIHHQTLNILVENLKQLLYQTAQDSYKQKYQVLNPATCNHGDNYYDGINIQVCYKSINLPITVSISYYPEIFPIVSQIPNESKIRDFTTQNNWIENLVNMKQKKRWTILSHWKMVLSKTGIYDIPNLVIQGSLEIQGNADITLNLRGIYIGAGSFTVSSSFTGKLTINFVSKDPSEIIFNNPYEEASFKEGNIVINNKFSIENSKNNLKPYRILRYNILNNQDVRNQIVIKGLNIADVSLGDEVYIVSPRTGESIFTSISDTPKQGISSDYVILSLKVELPFLFSTKLDNIQVNSTTILLTPYVKIFRKRIQINNFNIVTLSHGNKFIPNMMLKGVYFENSSINQMKIISSITLEDCIFNIIKEQDYIFTNTKTIYYTQSQTYSPQFTLTNNLFIKSNQPILLNPYYAYNYQGNDYYHTYLYNENINFQVKISRNIIVDSVTALYTYYRANLNDNIIIKASQSCSASVQCQNHLNDFFYFCNDSGINYKNCDIAQNLLVAFSGTFFKGQIRQVSNVVSIQNQIHFQPFAGSYDANIPLNKYDVLINSSIVVSDLIESNQQCIPTKAIQLFTPQDSLIQVPTITVKDSYFYNFQCSKGISFQSNQPINEQYHPSLAFQNSYCKDCQFAQLTDLIDAQSQVPPSFLVQDYKSLFLGQNPRETSSYLFTSMTDSPYIQIEQSQNILGRLFIRTLQSTNKDPYSLTGNTYNTQQIVEKQGSIILFPLNKLYPLQASSLGQISLRMSSHNLQSLEYIQLILKVGKEKGLKIRQNFTLVLPTFGLDSSKGFEIMKLVNSQESKIKCGVNIYDPKQDEYHIILTNNQDCLIYLFEYSTVKVVISIPTPILPPPPPEEVNMCLAQRQMLFVINKISSILKIDKRRVKMHSQSNVQTCKLRRVLQSTLEESEQISFSFAIDAEDSENENNCIFNTSCTEQQKQIEEASASQMNLQTFQSLQTLQEKAIEIGFVISSVDATLPNLVSLCPQDQYYQESTCVNSCFSNYFTPENSAQKVCVKCNIACKTCGGQSTQDCKLVQNSQELDCADNYKTFKTEEGKKYCGKCPANCKIDCQLLQAPLCPENQCQNGYVNQNGVCLKQCANYFFNYRDSGICKKCQSYCKEDCKNGQCECNVGYYKLDEFQSEICAACPKDCATCTSDQVCLTCKDQTYDERQACLYKKYIPEEQQENQLALILGLTFGSGIFIILGILIAKYYYKRSSKNKQTIKINKEKSGTEQNLQNDEQIQTLN